MNNNKLKPIEIRNISDIRKAISPFIKEVNPGKVDIASDVTWTNEEGKKQTSTVKAHSSDVNMRQSLIDGFEQVKEHSRMWNDMHNILEEDEYGASLPKPNIDDMLMPVDKIIKYRLGGKREGMTIVWELNGRKIVFDPYSKKLEELGNQ